MVVIEEVLAGREPPAFTVQFIQWEPEVAAKWLATDKLVMANKQVGEVRQAAIAAATAALADPFEGHLDPASNKFPYEVLKSSFPEGVPPTKKEYYLSDEEFVQHLGMGVDEWESLKQWKRDNKKKAVGLF
mmetsp:Transcript_6949/g.8354  ORF Transcript_6949/g.8354 Transcript_6949/m.8354 type:complete len:131 (-) Transcript_6949:229-621(-)